MGIPVIEAKWLGRECSMTTQQSDALAHIADEDDSAFVAATMTGMQHTKLQSCQILTCWTYLSCTAESSMEEWI
jgi:hypothetical protein